MFSIYKVTNPTKEHEMFRDCLCSSSGLFKSAVANPEEYTCVKFRISNNVKDAFISFDFKDSELTLVKDYDPNYWESECYVYPELFNYRNISLNFI